MTYMFEAALAALREIFSPPFRAVLIKSLGMTLVFLALAWVGLDKLALSFVTVNHPWLQLALAYATGVGLFLFLAFLLGREYFLFAATRFRSLEEATELRRRYAPQLFVAGLFIALFVATPGLNVLTPLFGVAFMTRIHKMLSPERRARYAGR
jgi:uncharacterized protein involved in cysteine biosynthesis